MLITPLFCILLGSYVFFRKMKARLSDSIYRMTYNLTGTCLITYGCVSIISDFFLREIAIKHGYYEQVLFIKLALGNISVGFLIIFGLIEVKLEKEKKKKTGNSLADKS